MNTHVIIVKKEHYQETERHGDKDPFHIQSPEIDEPTPRLCWKKWPANR